jgi:hypothetical protein
MVGGCRTQDVKLWVLFVRNARAQDGRYRRVVERGGKAPEPSHTLTS